MRKKKRMTALLMAGILMVSNLPMNVIQAEGKQNMGGLCEHHTEHNEECGYFEGIPCSHEHEKECYTLVEQCIHEHTEECYLEEEDGKKEDTATLSNAEKSEASGQQKGEAKSCSHICDKDTGCITETIACLHEEGQHDETCGYMEAVPCTFVCEECAEDADRLGNAAVLGGANLMTEEVGDFTVTDGQKGVDYEYAKQTLTIKTDTVLAISGTTTQDKIVIQEGVEANIILIDVNIDRSKSSNVAAFDIQSGAICNLTLYGENTLKSGNNKAGLHIQDGAKLKITEESTGALTATGKNYGAGIGSGNKGKTCDISISGGNITAIGGNGGAGIGSGASSPKDSKCDISISGGNITATGGTNGAGIGSGAYNSASSDIRISGGNITATGGENGAGIGSGALGSVGSECDIRISGGRVTATGGNKGAGIGSGESGRQCDISIEGGNVTATGGDYAVGIGSGRFCKDYYNINISGGSVTATGGVGGAGIGNGYEAKGGDIYISGGSVTATGKNDASGIGISYNPKGDGGGNVCISGGSVTAIGGGNGAGIGRGMNPGGEYTFSTNEGENKGNALIIASSIDDQSGKKKGEWSGIIFDGDKGFIYGSPLTPTSDLEIPKGKALEIKDGEILIIEEGVTLINRGIITIYGSLDNFGVIQNYGIIQPDFNDEIILDVPSVISLSFSEDTVTYGESIVMTAKVAEQSKIFARRAAINQVNFYLGGTDGILLGTADVIDGEARFEVTEEVWESQRTKWILGEDGNTITAEFGGSEKGSLLANTTSEELVVEPISINETNVDISQTEFYYDGSVKKPKVQLDGNPLTVWSDYAVEYRRNGVPSSDFIHAGKIEMKITGMGIYQGVVDISYVIKQSGTDVKIQTYLDEQEETEFIYGQTIAVKASLSATGEAPNMRRQIPPTSNEAALYVRKDGIDTQLTEPNEVVSGEELRFTYDTKNKQLAIGENELVVKYVESENMTGAEAAIHVTLEEKELIPTVIGTAQKVYDGTTEVEDGDLEISLFGVENEDSVSVIADFNYENADAEENKEIYITNLSLEGEHQAYYTLSIDSLTTTGMITPAPAPSIAYPTASELTYGQKVSDSTLSFIDNQYGSFAWADAVKDIIPEAGENEYQVIFTPSEATQNNYEEIPNKEENILLVVNKADLSTAVVKVNRTYSYTGMEITPVAEEVSVELGERTVDSDQYQISATNNLNAGEAVITVTAVENGNYENAAQGTFIIEPADSLYIVYPTASELTYGQKISDSTLSFTTNEYGSFVWAEPEQIPEGGVNGYSMKFTPDALTLQNYKTIENPIQDVVVSVQQASATVDTKISMSGDNDNRQAEFAITVSGVENGLVPTGTVTITDAQNLNQTLELDDEGKAKYTWSGLAEQEYTVQIRYSGDTNYASNEQEMTWDASKKEQEPFVVADLGQKVYGDEPFTLVATGGSGTGDVTFISSNPDVLSISGDIATIHKAGTVTITAKKEADEQYNPVETQIILVIDKATPELKLTPSEEHVQGSGTVTLTLAGVLEMGDTEITVSCSDDSIVVSGSGLEWSAELPNESQTYTFTASYAGSENYYGGEANCQVTVTKKTETSSSGSRKSYKIASEYAMAMNSYPSYVVKGSWTQMPEGKWRFSSNGISYRNTWIAAYNPYANTAQGQTSFDWFYFDEEGYMVTGWLEDNGRKFYLNPVSDGTKGALMVNTWIGEYYVDKEGKWKAE